MKKKILIVAWAFYPSVGGMEEQSYTLAQEFIRRGYAVDVLTESLSANSPRKELYDGITIFRTPYQKKRGAINFLSLTLNMAMFSLRHGHQYDIAIIRGALTFEPLIFGLFKFLKIFRTTTFVTADTGGENDEIIMIKRSRIAKLLTFFASQHDYLNSLCKANYRHYQELGIDNNKLTEISNGLVIPNRNNFQPPKQIKTLLFLGRLHDYKGIRELLKAFKTVHSKHPQIQLIIGGTGPEQSAVINFIKQNKLSDDLKYAGEINPKEKGAFFACGDCLVLPSHSEAFSLVVYEAAIYKKAIIATPVADLKSKFGEKINYCKIKDAKHLSQQMEKLIEQYHPSMIDYDSVLNTVNIKTTAEEIIDLIKT